LEENIHALEGLVALCKFIWSKSRQLAQTDIPGVRRNPRVGSWRKRIFLMSGGTLEHECNALVCKLLSYRPVDDDLPLHITNRRNTELVDFGPKLVNSSLVLDQAQFLRPVSSSS
jgi:hypothetical protein